MILESTYASVCERLDSEPGCYRCEEQQQLQAACGFAFDAGMKQGIMERTIVALAVAHERQREKTTRYLAAAVDAREAVSRLEFINRAAADVLAAYRQKTE